MQEKNRVITTKKGKGKLPLFCGNGEQVIPIYDVEVFWSWAALFSYILGLMMLFADLEPSELHGVEVHRWLLKFAPSEITYWCLMDLAPL